MTFEELVFQSLNESKLNFKLLFETLLHQRECKEDKFGISSPGLFAISPEDTFILTF